VARVLHGGRDRLEEQHGDGEEESADGDQSHALSVTPTDVAGEKAR
jgi:hypothetical protein